MARRRLGRPAVEARSRRGKAMEVFFTHPFWIWLALGAVLLAIEVGTGSGYLLWPSAAGALIGVLALIGVMPEWPLQIVIFAVLTIVSTVMSRRYLHKPLSAKGPDINDQKRALLGREGRVVRAFDGRDGRVFVEGKEWAAELEGADTAPQGARVQVTDVVGGARLKVRPV